MTERVLSARELNRALLVRHLLLERSPSPCPAAGGGRRQPDGDRHADSDWSPDLGYSDRQPHTITGNLLFDR